MKIKFLIIGSAILLCSCAPVEPQFDRVQNEYHINVDSISSQDAENKKKFILYPGTSGIDENDLQYQEYAQYIKRALAAQGYISAANFNEADIAIFLGYGIGEPKQNNHTYSLPTWGQTGLASATSTGSVQKFGNTATYSGTTTYTPSFGITGSNTYTDTYTTYFRYIFLDALDLSEYRASKKEKQLWKVSVNSTGSSGDLRRVFPVMVAASKPYIGKNSGQKIQISIDGSDTRVLEIKGLPTK